MERGRAAVRGERQRRAQVGAGLRARTRRVERRAKCWGSKSFVGEGSIACVEALGWRLHAFAYGCRRGRGSACARRAGLRGRPDDAAVAGQRRDALHRLLGGPGHDDQLVRRGRARRGGRRGDGRRADPDRGVRAGRGRDRHRPGVLGVADLLSGRRGHEPGDRRDLRVDQRVRREGRAGDADRRDHRHAGGRARPDERRGVARDEERAGEGERREAGARARGAARISLRG